MNYTEFASKISFFEFLEKEFKDPHFKTSEYADEINLLKQTINIDYLTRVLQTNPKIIDIFEEILQLRRFTNTQYINFCFDINTLNNLSDPLIIKYIENRVFNFETGDKNQNFQDLYEKASSEKENLIFNVKRTIIPYINKCIKKREIFYTHLKNSIDSRVRISKYLIENLNISEHLSSLKLEKFLKTKRYPVDTKGMHGRFGTKKISNILENSGFVNINEKVHERKIEVNTQLLEAEHKNQFYYLREKTIKGIVKKKDKKPKRFDFILIYNRKPQVLIETNFYTTSGTKIGINQNEYVDLLDNIQKFNKKQHSDLQFSWITDGNYWLTKNGEERFVNLKKNYFKNEHELLNYNLLKNKIENIKEKIIKK